MADEPISNPGVTPTPGTPEYGRDKPRLGEGEEAEAQRPFSLSPEGGEKTSSENVSPEQRPSPMDVAGDAAKQQKQMAPEQLSEHISNLQNRFSTLQTQLQDTKITDQFTSDHTDALKKVTDKLNPDMQTIAKNSNGEFTPPQSTTGEHPITYLAKWLDGGQGTLGNALSYLENTKKPDIGSYLRLQYAVQRATQRGELFASIVGASVSGVKTIMSTQLG